MKEQSICILLGLSTLGSAFCSEENVPGTALAQSASASSQRSCNDSRLSESTLRKATALLACHEFKDRRRAP